MAGNDDDDNPFASPDSDLDRGRPRRALSVKSKVSPPAIFLLIVGGLGAIASVFNIVYALVSGPPVIDPNAPEFVRNMQAGAVGPLAFTIQAVFLIVNAVILAGALQMLRMQNRILAIAASVLAMVNVGTCCCCIGLPAGIWSLVVLLSPDVVQAFEEGE